MTGRDDMAKMNRRGAMRSPRSIVEIGLQRKGKVPLVFREVAPGKKVAHVAPDPEAQIRDSVKRMRRDATRAIIGAGGNPKQAAQIISSKEQLPDGADSIYWAACLYEQLAKTENCLRVLLTCPAEDARWQGLNLALQMDLSRFFWQRLRLVDNEKPIADLIVSKEAGKLGAVEKARGFLDRNVEMAKEYESRQQKSPKSRKSPTSLKAEIGREHGLGRSASIEAIKKVWTK
jgi:hypothetical protein